MKAGLYARISEDRDGDAMGVGRQLIDLRKLADRNGWQIADEYVDNDVSAFSGKRRPEYERLLADIEAGTVDAIVAWHPDRLHRSPIELERFIGVVEHANARVATVTAGAVDLGTPSGRAIARTLGAWARFESEHKAERIARKHRERAEAGLPIGGGTRPFGYEPGGMVIRQAEAQLITDAATRIIAGDTLRSICREWNERGITSVTGRTWRPSVLRSVLVGGRIAGRREHRDLVVPAAWPAIIDEVTSARLRAILLDPDRRVAGSNARRYLLGGMVFCGLCGKPLRSRPDRTGKRRYVCSALPAHGGCGRMGIVADPLEDMVVAAVLRVLDDPALDARMAEHDGADAEQRLVVDEITRDEATLRELSNDFYIERRISRVEYESAASGLRERVATARGRLRRRRRTPVLAEVSGHAVDRWPALGLDRQRAVIAALIERIDIAPSARIGSRFDVDRVYVTWAG